MNNVVSRERPDLDEALKSVPKSCDPYFVCMIVAPRTASASAKKSHHQHTNIFIARDPYALVQGLENGTPLADIGAVDLAPIISKILPPPVPRAKRVEQQYEEEEEENDEEEAAAATVVLPPVVFDPLPPPPPKHVSMSIEKTGEEWIERAVAAIGMNDALKLSAAIERGEYIVESAVRNLEQLRKDLIQDTLGSGITVEPLLPVALPAPQRAMTLKISDPRRRRQKRKPKQQSEENNKKKKRPRTFVSRGDRTGQKLGMILGPVLTYEAASLIGTVWGLKSRGSIPRSALGEILAERFSISLYADLAVVFEGEDFERHVLRQTESGELWLVKRSQAAALDAVLSKK